MTRRARWRQPLAIEIRVEDEDGVVIRRFEEEVHQGLNRVTWDLRRDDFGRPVTGEGQGEDPDFRSSGILVLPGTYRITVAFGDEVRSAR